MDDCTRALNRLAELAGEQRAALERLARIPSCSFAGFPPEPLHDAAVAVCALLKECGLAHVESMHQGASFPYVLARSAHLSGAPTVLFYAHYDVQPAGDEERWRSPPFTPSERAGRLYGRGVADNKAGIVAIAFAVRAFLESVGGLPINVKILIEGEEEIGSPNLAAFLKAQRTKLDADALVLADAGNFDTGLPAITHALRGLVTVDVEVRALAQSLHSGAWGGPVPDAAMALCKMLASLTRSDGRIADRAITQGAITPSARERRAVARLPLSRRRFRAQAGLLPGVRLLGRAHPLATNWYTPSLCVSAIEASSRKDARNILVASAWARVGVRLVRGMDPARVQRSLVSALKRAAPWGVEVHVETDVGGPAWYTESDHPAFEATRAALHAGYGRAPVLMGCGASIPIVGAFAEAFGGIPALLIGVEDPYTNGHSEDESVHLADFARATRSLVHMLAGLPRALAPRRGRTRVARRTTRTRRDRAH